MGGGSAQNSHTKKRQQTVEKQPTEAREGPFQQLTKDRSGLLTAVANKEVTPDARPELPALTLLMFDR